MDVTERRRALLMMPRGLDTSPIIDEYNTYWHRTFGQKLPNDDWCITKFYDAIEDPPETDRTTKIMGYVGNDTSNIAFQYEFTNGSTDWWYFAGTNPRQISNTNRKRVARITFSLEISEIDNSYAYLVETGQIFFAGKNTPYYGHRNISELN